MLVSIRSTSPHPGCGWIPRHHQDDLLHPGWIDDFFVQFTSNPQRFSLGTSDILGDRLIALEQPHLSCLVVAFYMWGPTKSAQLLVPGWTMFFQVGRHGPWITRSKVWIPGKLHELDGEVTRWLRQAVSSLVPKQKMGGCFLVSLFFVGYFGGWVFPLSHILIQRFLLVGTDSSHFR